MCVLYDVFRVCDVFCVFRVCVCVMCVVCVCRVCVNHAVWEYRTMFFKALVEPPSNHEGATRISAYATTLWDGTAPKE